MTRADYAAKLSDKLNLVLNEGKLDSSKIEISKAMADKIHVAESELMAEVVRTEDSVPIPGIGKMILRHLKERKGHNPQTKEEILIPAKDIPGLKVFESAKDAFNV